MKEPEKPQSGGRWGDYIALAIGTGLIAYFTRQRSGVSTGPAPKENWIEVALVCGGVLLVLGLITYGILRAWDALTARFRRRD